MDRFKKSRRKQGNKNGDYGKRNSEEGRVDRKQATRDSWRTQPMPEAKDQLQINRIFSFEEYQLIKLGFIPETMEDKWFICFEGDWLYFHRSWTGICIYQARLEALNNSYKIAEVWVNRDMRYYKNIDDEYDATSVIKLIERFLLENKYASSV